MLAIRQPIVNTALLVIPTTYPEVATEARSTAPAGHFPRHPAQQMTDNLLPPCYITSMLIRPLQPDDLDQLEEIDATIESTQYLHVNQEGEGLSRRWEVAPRPLREKLIEANRLSDESRFMARQIATGVDEGVALVAAHREHLAGLLLARMDDVTRTAHLVELRVDYDARRQGLATGLIFQLIQMARQREYRAVRCQSRTNNEPASQLLLKCGFELAGIDTLHDTNHDLVKEQVTLIWYAPLE